MPVCYTSSNWGVWGLTKLVFLECIDQIYKDQKAPWPRLGWSWACGKAQEAWVAHRYSIWSKYMNGIVAWIIYVIKTLIRCPILDPGGRGVCLFWLHRSGSYGYQLTLLASRWLVANTIIGPTWTSTIQDTSARSVCGTFTSNKITSGDLSSTLISSGPLSPPRPGTRISPVKARKLPQSLTF